MYAKSFCCVGLIKSRLSGTL